MGTVGEVAPGLWGGMDALVTSRAIALQLRRLNGDDYETE